jgi:Zn-dependent protease
VFANPLLFLIGAIYLLPAIAIAIPAHEIGHAVAATAMGDPSAKNRGFLRPRLGQYFTIYGVLAAFLANVSWGQMAPVNEYRLAGAGRKVVWVLGGPAANLLVAIVFGLVLRVLIGIGGGVNLITPIVSPIEVATNIVYAIYFLNLSTFAFNLLPIPGLDGWRVLEALFRRSNPRLFFDVAARAQTIWLVCLILIIAVPFLLHFDLLGAVVGIFFEPAALAILGQCSGYTSLQPCPVSVGF